MTEIDVGSEPATVFPLKATTVLRARQPRWRRPCTQSWGLISWSSTATLMVWASSSSTLSQPSNWRNLIKVVASQGLWCSKYAWPEKNRQVGASPQRSTTPSSDSSKACLRYGSAIMIRSATRGRPALLATATAAPVHRRDRSGMARPTRPTDDAGRSVDRCASGRSHPEITPKFQVFLGNIKIGIPPVSRTVCLAH